MRSTLMFRDQVQKMTDWFQCWNECEQIVALFSLLRKLNRTQTKFLYRVLEQSLLDNSELVTLETQANNPAYISSLCQESKEHAVSQLLACLPLLQPGNNEAKAEYLNILPLILNHSVENGCHIEESRQLLSYSLIHPAMTNTERSQLTVWLRHLESRYTSGQRPGCVRAERAVNGETMTSSAPPAVSSVAGSVNGVGGGGGGGRAITSTAAVKSPSVCGLQTAGTDVNFNAGTRHCQGHHGQGQGQTNNGAGTHSPIHGSTAFSNVPSHASSTEHASSFQILPHSTIGSTGHVQSSVQCSSGHRKLTRSVSGVAFTNTAAFDSSVCDWLNRHQEEMVHESLHVPLGATQSEPAHAQHAPLSPQSSVSSSGSGSEGHHDDQQQMRNTFLEEGSGMRDVPVWLKSLRLHKYSYLFQTMTYEEMLGLTEDWLKARNVTKGARNKIILNTKKLQERYKCLQVMEKEVMESGNMKQALMELRTMLNTPIKAYTPAQTGNTPSENVSTVNTGNPAEFSSSTDGSAIEGSMGSVESSSSDTQAPDEVSTGVQEVHDGDLPGQITRVLGKMCTQLLVSTRPEDECFTVYLQMLDKCMMHEAFTVEQKRKLLSWKQQIQKIWHPIPQRFGLDRQRKGFGNTFPPNNILRNQRALRGQTVSKQGQLKWTFGGQLPVTPAPIGTGPSIPPYRSSAFLGAAYTPIRPTMVELKAPLARTHSAPIKSSAFSYAVGPRPVPDMSVTEPEINARLDSLCLSMTEHALGSFTDTL